MIQQNEQTVNSNEVNQSLPANLEGLAVATPNSENFAQFAFPLVELQEDAMSAECDKLFDYLTPPESDKEKAHRGKLFDSYNGYRRSRYAFGEALHQYWFWCKRPDSKGKGKKAQRTTFDQLCDILKLDRRTGYYILSDYRTACEVQLPIREAAQSLNIDLASHKHSGLIAELKQQPNILSFPNPKQHAIDVVNQALANQEANKFAKPELSRLEKLTDFLYGLYGGKETAEQMRSDLKVAQKKVLHYERGDNMVPTKKESTKTTKEVAN